MIFIKDVRNAWVNCFSKRELNIEYYQTDSIVDLVKLHQSGTPVFPNNIDIVAGGFPYQNFSISDRRKGLNSHKNHKRQLKTDILCGTSN